MAFREAARVQVSVCSLFLFILRAEFIAAFFGCLRFRRLQVNHRFRHPDFREARLDSVRQRVRPVQRQRSVHLNVYVDENVAFVLARAKLVETADAAAR
jgi:hypothetical protein